MPSWGRLTGGLRRAWLGKVQVRPLTWADRDEALAFCGTFLSLNLGFLERQLRTRWTQGKGACAGAFSRSGRMVGFAFLDQYREEGADVEGWWIRFLFTAPIARGLGCARQMVRVLCAQAQVQGVERVSADVRRENARSVALFKALGFCERPGGSGPIARLRPGAEGEGWLWLEANAARVSERGSGGERA